jgi:YVTN family beta-propeller protein
VAFLPDGSRAYVPSENGGSLSVIDVAKLSVIKTIAFAGKARAMGTVMAPDGSHVYVSTGSTKMVMFVDTKTNQVDGSVEAGQRVWGIGVSPDGKTLYTANGPSNDVSIIDVASKQVTAKIPVGKGPWGIAVVPAPTAN